MSWNRGQRYHGWDLALNHSAFVELDEAGKMTWYNYVVSAPGQVEDNRATFLQVAAPPEADKQLKQVRRLVWWKRHIKSLLDARRPSFVAIEDYAIKASGNSAYNIGELGGTARTAVLDWSVELEEAIRGSGHPRPAPAKLRLHDPMSVKMYLAHRGDAHPETVAHEVEERWPDAKLWHDWHEIPRLDMAVAYGLAQMCKAEVELRAGKRKLTEFHLKEIQVFNRVTKTYPQSLLARDWITA